MTKEEIRTTNEYRMSKLRYSFKGSMTTPDYLHLTAQRVSKEPRKSLSRRITDVTGSTASYGENRDYLRFGHPSFIRQSSFGIRFNLYRVLAISSIRYASSTSPSLMSL